MLRFALQGVLCHDQMVEIKPGYRGDNDIFIRRLVDIHSDVALGSQKASRRIYPRFFPCCCGNFVGRILPDPDF